MGGGAAVPNSIYTTAVTGLCSACIQTAINALPYFPHDKPRKANPVHRHRGARRDFRHDNFNSRFLHGDVSASLLFITAVPRWHVREFMFRTMFAFCGLFYSIFHDSPGFAVASVSFRDFSSNLFISIGWKAANSLGLINIFCSCHNSSKYWSLKVPEVFLESEKIDPFNVYIY